MSGRAVRAIEKSLGVTCNVGRRIAACNTREGTRPGAGKVRPPTLASLLPPLARSHQSIVLPGPLIAFPSPARRPRPHQKNRDSAIMHYPATPDAQFAALHYTLSTYSRLLSVYHCIHQPDARRLSSSRYSKNWYSTCVRVQQRQPIAAWPDEIASNLTKRSRKTVRALP